MDTCVVTILVTFVVKCASVVVFIIQESMQDCTKLWDGRPVIDSFTYDFAPGERIGIAGPNGVISQMIMHALTRRFLCTRAPTIYHLLKIGWVICAGSGKSTLLDMITGRSELDSGVRVEGDTTVVGYFQQHPPEVNPRLKIIDHVAKQAAFRCVMRIILCRSFYSLSG